MTNLATSLCIPRMESIVTKDFIFKTFQKLNIGYIERIIEIPLHNDIKYKRIILIIFLNNNPLNIMIRNQMSNNETVKLVYDMPWYWKIHGTRPRVKGNIDEADVSLTKP